MKDKTLAAFVAELAARTPVPGGGSAAAAAAAFGAALGAMAAAFTKDSAAADIARRLEDAASDLLDAAQRDADAYARVSQAMGMPKRSEEEKRARRDAIQSALRGAAEVPLETMRRCRDALAVLAEFAPQCNRNLASDLATAAWLLRAGLEGAAHNVRVNLDSMTDGLLRSQWGTEADRLRADAEALQRSLEDGLRGGPSA
jgi:formiminotetrahydrofolate cyclodeaminase